jgi:hypothetical protein
MPMGRLAMRHVRDVMRLKAAGLSISLIIQRFQRAFGKKAQNALQ